MTKEKGGLLFTLVLRGFRLKPQVPQLRMERWELGNCSRAPASHSYATWSLRIFSKCPCSGPM